MLRQIGTTKSRPDINPQSKPLKSVDEYLADLDALLKRNTGSGTFIGQDTSSNLPVYLPGKVANPTGLGTMPSVTSQGNGITQPAPVKRPDPMSVQTPMTAEDFLTQFDQIINPPGQSITGTTPDQDMIDYAQGMASTPDDGVLGQDGLIHYTDGSVRQGDTSAYPVTQLANGNVQYSDGSIREDRYAMASAGIDPMGRNKLLYNDQSVRTGDYVYQDGMPTPGLQGIEQGIFGQALPTTQPYGNNNPGMGYANNTHQGTDLRTRNLSAEQRQFKLPVNAEVVQVITADSGSPYGNSILLKLASGEMLRFSHLSQVANVQPGQVLSAGQVFGTPGSTGNSTAEHLDLEYYNKDGKIDNPANFTGEGLKTPVPGQSAPGTIIQPAPEPQKPQGQILGATNQAPTQPTINTPKTIKPNPTGNPAITAANAIDYANPTGKYGLGITETLRNQPEAARQEQANTISDIGTALHAPDLKTDELSMAQKTNPFRQLAGNLIDETARKLGVRTDFGISELVAGGKTTNTDQDLVTKASAAELPTNQAGAGIESLASAGAGDLQNVFKPTQPKETRAIGDVKGTVDESGNPQFSSLMDTAQSKAGMAKNDIRDPFFKMGGSEMYKDYMKPGIDANYNGALTLDLFNDNFYKDLGRISSVFGGSKDLGAATQKFVEFEKQKYPLMSRMDYSDEYDPASVDAYNKSVDEYNANLNNYFNSIGKSVAGSLSIFTPRLAGSAKNVFSGVVPSATAYSMSTAPKVSAPTAPTKTLASLAAAAPSVSAPSNSVNLSSPTSAPSASIKPQTQSKLSTLAAQVKPTSAPLPASRFNLSAETAAPSAQIQKTQVKPQSQPVSNVFSKVASYVNNIFRRR